MKIYLLAVAAAVVVAIGLFFYQESEQKVSEPATSAITEQQQDVPTATKIDLPQKSTLTDDSISTDPNKKILATAGTKELYIQAPVNHPTLSRSLFISDKSTGEEVRLLVIDYEDEQIQWSPDRRSVLIATEEAATVISIDTLAYKTIFTPEKGSLHGLLTAYPSFHPKVRWTSNTEIEISIYPNDKFYAEEAVEPKPLEVRTIEIN